MDRFNRAIVLLIVLFVLISSFSFIWFRSVDQSNEFDDFELGPDTTFRYSFEHYTSAVRNSGSTSEEYDKGFEYYTVTDVVGNNVHYTHTTVNNGSVDSVNIMCQTSEFLTFDEIYYRSLQHYKSESIEQSTAECGYKQGIKSTHYCFRYEYQDEDNDYCYEATLDAYVAKGYVVAHIWTLNEKTAHIQRIQKNISAIDDLIISSKTVKNSEPSVKMNSFVLTAGCEFERSVHHATGSSLKDKGYTVSSSELYNILSVGADIEYNLKEIAADGTEVISHHTTSVSAFWSKDVNIWVDDGYHVEMIYFEMQSLNTLGNLFTIKYNLSKETPTERIDVSYAVYNSVVVTYSMKTTVADGSWTEIFWKMV